MNPTALHQNLRDKLKLRDLAAREQFAQNHPHAKTFFDQVGVDLGKIRHHSARLLAAGALGSTLLLSPGTTHAQLTPLPEPIIRALLPESIIASNNPEVWLSDQMKILLPPIKDPWNLPKMDPREEKLVGKLIERSTGVPAVPTLEGEHLNTVYGYIGYEQHLMRYPGDSLAKHDEFQSAGIAPGLGGFGYFTQERKITSESVLREKYYVVAQLMYLPDWGKRTRYLANWYKWRKMIVVNVDTGSAAVGVMGDAGPAAWTGKHFGASPEIMNILGGPRFRKGRVLMYFVDDPQNKIPLGRVSPDLEKLNTLELISENWKKQEIEKFKV